MLDLAERTAPTILIQTSHHPEPNFSSSKGCRLSSYVGHGPLVLGQDALTNSIHEVKSLPSMIQGLPH